MTIGPKMAFILRVYHMTDAENAEDVERDHEMVAAGLMSQREFDKRIPTRDLARRIRQRDNTPGAWPRDPKIQIGRSTPTTGDRTDPVVGASLSEGETKH